MKDAVGCRLKDYVGCRAMEGGRCRSVRMMNTEKMCRVKDEGKRM